MSFVFHVADTKTAKPGAQVRRIGLAAVAEGGTEKQREGNQRGRTGEQEDCQAITSSIDGE